VKIRQGRRNPRNLYFQVGDKASDTDDICIGFMLDPEIGWLIVSQVNNDEWHLNEMRIWLENSKNAD
jgi:hypothetical protein